MNENLFYRLTILLLIILGISNYGYAQITIGSGGMPNKGALLDLKEKTNIAGEEGQANSTKGLLLPRVKMTTTQPAIGKMAQSIGSTSTWDEAQHIGLVVYNTVNTLEACTGGANMGAYTWNGKQWIAIFENKILPPAGEHSTDQATGANSYILQSGAKTVDIPIQRGFDIWNAYQENSSTDGKVLDLTDVNNLIGALATNVVWQETSDGLNTGVLDATNPVSISGTGQTAKLVVKSGAKTGNALVNVTIDGKVLWQWHIWVTEDDPRAAAYMFNTGKHVYWFMDRTLGATSTSRTSAYGLYYQWGRSTPMRRTDTGFTTVKATAAEKENLTTAIQSDKFIIYNNKTSHDWYSATAKQWNARWGDQTVKSSFDPCPLGWRVPGNNEGESPWHCLDKTENTSNESGFIENGRDIGFYALAGYRANGDGSLGDVGETGYIWTASPSEALAAILQLNNTTINTNQKYNRANGMNVRCVKEIE